jgi:hypothetical protein
LRTAIRQLNINYNVSKPKPKWKFTKARGAMVRKGKASSINAIRYHQEVLILKLIPFAKQCSLDYIVQEDKALAYASHFQKTLIGYIMFIMFSNFSGQATLWI